MSSRTPAGDLPLLYERVWGEAPLTNADARDRLKVNIARIRRKLGDLQQFVNQSHWDPAPVVAAYRARMATAFAAPDGLIVVDDTGLLHRLLVRGQVQVLPLRAPRRQGLAQLLQHCYDPLGDGVAQHARPRGRRRSRADGLLRDPLTLPHANSSTETGQTP